MSRSVTVTLVTAVSIAFSLLGCFSPVPNPALPEKADFVLTVDELVDAYRANELRADTQYKHQVLEVTGRVDSVKKSGSTFEVLLDTKRTAVLSSVRCEFDQDYGLKNLAAGQPVTVRGRCMGRNVWINLEGCQLVVQK